MTQFLNYTIFIFTFASHSCFLCICLEGQERIAVYCFLRKYLNPQSEAIQTSTPVWTPDGNQLIIP